MKRIAQRWIGVCSVAGIACGLLSLLAGARPAAAQNPTTFYAPPPELLGGPWLNTSENAPVTLASLHGKVTILHFWTFG